MSKSRAIATVIAALAKTGDIHDFRIEVEDAKVSFVSTANEERKPPTANITADEWLRKHGAA